MSKKEEGKILFECNDLNPEEKFELLMGNAVTKHLYAVMVHLDVAISLLLYEQEQHERAPDDRLCRQVQELREHLVLVLEGATDELLQKRGKWREPL